MRKSLPLLSVALLGSSALAAGYDPHAAFAPFAMPTPDDVRIFRVTPVVISVLDYSKGFGHSDLVTC